MQSVWSSNQTRLLWPVGSQCCGKSRAPAMGHSFFPVGILGRSSLSPASLIVRSKKWNGLLKYLKQRTEQSGLFPLVSSAVGNDHLLGTFTILCCIERNFPSYSLVCVKSVTFAYRDPQSPDPPFHLWAGAPWYHSLSAGPSPQHSLHPSKPG
jgi:hypothetical protein